MKSRRHLFRKMLEVKIDLTLKGIKTQHPAQQHNVDHIVVKTDLIQKGLKLGKVFFIRLAGENNGGNRPDLQRD